MHTSDFGRKAFKLVCGIPEVLDNRYKKKYDRNKTKPHMINVYVVNPRHANYIQ